MVNWKFILGFYAVLILSYILLMIILSRFSGYSMMENARDVTIILTGSIFGGLCYALWEKAFTK